MTQKLDTLYNSNININNVENIDNIFTLDNLEISLTNDQNLIAEIQEYESIWGPQLTKKKKNKISGKFEQKTFYLYKELLLCRSKFREYACKNGCDSVYQYVTCKNKLCSHCNQIRRHKFQQKYKSYVYEFKDPKHLTLTRKNTDEIDKDYVKKSDKHLNAFKRRIKRAKDKKGNLLYKIQRGIIVRECTNKGNGYHYHYHILFDGSHLPAADLIKWWHEITGDSYIIHISDVKYQFELYQSWCKQNNKKSKQFYKYCTDYVLQYFYKKNSFQTVEQLIHWFKISKNMRLINKLGSDKKIIQIEIFDKICPHCNKNSLEYYKTHEVADYITILDSTMLKLRFEVEKHVWVYPDECLKKSKL